MVHDANEPTLETLKSFRPCQRDTRAEARGRGYSPVRDYDVEMSGVSPLFVTRGPWPRPTFTCSVGPSLVKHCTV